MAWFKVPISMLDDYEFGRLPDVMKAHAFGIWTLAARHGNDLPSDAEWLGRRMNATEPLDLDALVDAGLIEFVDGWGRDPG